VKSGHPAASQTVSINVDATFFTMVEANGPGVFCGIFYVTVFLRCVKPGDARGTALRGYLLGGAALLFAEAVALLVLRGRAVFGLGLLGAIGSAQIALSPFKTLPEVLRTRSTRSWPVDLCLWSFIQSSATGSFGLAIQDAWILVPNLIGIVAAGLQLALIVMLSDGFASLRAASTRRGRHAAGRGALLIAAAGMAVVFAVELVARARTRVLALLSEVSALSRALSLHRLDDSWTRPRQESGSE